jgi:hypothetical protein
LTLPDQRFLYVAIVLLALTVLVGLVTLFPYQVYNLKCQQFDMPGYEEAFGFTLGHVKAPGGAWTPAIAAVTPGGVFDRAGVRPGDVPHMHHGLGDFCGTLSAALAGGDMDLRVYNIHDAAAPGSSRDLRLRIR